MSFKSFVRELREMKDGIGNISRRGAERKQHWSNRTRAHIVPDVALSDPIEQGQWANLPPELLLDIIRRVEESEASWPARSVIVFCASVCKSWREITKEIVKTPEECGRLTFPISLKQPGPRESPIQCFIKRDRANSVYRLYFGMTPSEDERDKLLLAAKKIRRATSTDFVISLVADDFSRASNTYAGKLRSNFLGTKFSIYDSQPPSDAAIQRHGRLSRRFHAKQVSPRVPACNYKVATISYELNVLRTRGPRRMHCPMHSIPLSSIQEGGSAPTPTSFPQSFDEKTFSAPLSKAKESAIDINSSGFSRSAVTVTSQELLVLKNKAPRWHEQLQCWCLNFKGRVTVASVKNFQLVAAVDPSHNIPVAEQEKVILQFGKIGKDIFTMDYRYPLSAFQAFAICLSSFDTKPACE
ncbi:tubby-like F-box protein 5 [Nicotiana tabacum]|uniref:Tubby-like F-box protein n=1 Tax=Nicotiana tabacum TaxID=4097 RepID=A0A1S4CCH7_TOBAC|nr:tubby-like F-box protein 5 [Nicotiana tomentosiformis]XP_009603272.1 tubby-like F-box protein 5 [Nicotiana tomentosiformis]XP_016498659.1 PREDICTED: tubby-like F-box protein 5 [Nicotiana tabacum]XP_016498660.1 PREDICTED: tubby-like F-box protein 5 [Nicotiana tabacum]XP_016498661.1 PREDICTED: tubby-like F-box protein 5 [Nicotiana tabacum]XP_033512541.1 tubby-like F-box protein 5 [Nicotiana tomentosiformis]